MCTESYITYILRLMSDKCHTCHDMQSWHEILGHCKYEDVLKLQKVVNGMQVRARLLNQIKSVKYVVRENLLKPGVEIPIREQKLPCRWYIQT